MWGIVPYLFGANTMKITHWPGRFLAGLGLSVITLSGCQTWTSGMTLPSGFYLQHAPQYFPPSPPFPLPRELASQEAAAAAALAGAAPGAAVPLPVPVPPAAPAPAPGGPPAPLPPPPP
jgi:hypothetical protein